MTNTEGITESVSSEVDRHLMAYAVAYFGWNMPDGSPPPPMNDSRSALIAAIRAEVEREQAGQIERMGMYIDLLESGITVHNGDRRGGKVLDNLRTLAGIQPGDLDPVEER